MPRSTRASYSCSRCYKRKKKCDRSYPSCSQCTVAKARCIALDRVSDSELPRSLASYLEELVAQLKAQLDSQLASARPVEVLPQEVTRASTPCPTWIEQEKIQRAYTLAAAVARAHAFPDSSGRASRHALPYYRTFFKGAELPFPLAFQDPRPINIPHNGGEVHTPPLPPDVADKLMAVYADRILPQYPLFLREEIDSIFSRFKNETATPDERFITYITLAIATLSSRTRNYPKLVSVAESLRRVAFSCLEFGLACNRATTTTIQQLLLLAHYGFLLPSSTNLWQIVGDASRIAVELGLHRETLSRLYAIERSVAITSHRPYGVGQDQIHLALPQLEVDPNFPEESPESSADPSVVDVPYLRFADRLHFLRLQAEICSINIGMRPVPDSHLSYQDWSVDMEGRVSELESHSATLKWCTFMEWRSTLLLHMPCSRNPKPDENSILKYFDAALRIVDLHWEILDAGNLTYIWHATHHCYEAGNLLLYAIWFHRELIQGHYTTARVFEVVHRITGVFILLEKRWPAAQQCATLFDRLRKKALSYFADEEPFNPELILEARQVKDLVFRENADFLYACEQPASATTLEPALPTFDLDGLTFDHFIDFSGFIDVSGTVDLGEDFGLFEQAPIDNQMEPSTVSELALISEHQDRVTDILEEPSQRAIDESQLNRAVRNLPICSPCKKRRIRCDMNLPACRNCVKYVRDCVYWDSALGEDISRKTINDLYEVAQELLHTCNQPCHEPELSSHVAHQLPADFLPSDTKTLSTSSTSNLPSILCSVPGPTAKPVDMVFFGSTSAFGRLASGMGSLLLLQETSIPIAQPIRLLDALCNSFVLSSVGRIAQTEAEDLVWHYYRAVETIYPILGQDLLSETINDIYNSGDPKPDTKLSELRLNLVLAISLALLSVRDSRLQVVATTYFNEAMSCGISCDYFVDPSISSLQLVLLLCVYAWICPTAMEIWRLLGHGSRMFLDMMEAHGSDKRASLHTGVLYRTLYTLETEVSLVLGRPHQLPDGQELPALTPDPSSQMAGDLSTLRYNLIRYHYRFHRDLICSDRRGSHGQSFLDPAPDPSSWMAFCVSEIKLWLQDWNARVDAFNPGPSDHDTNTNMDEFRSILRASGEMKQCEALLLAKTASDRRGQLLISPEDELVICKRLLHAASTIHDRSSRPGPGQTTTPAQLAQQLISPFTLTYPYVLFNALVVLLEHVHRAGSAQAAEEQELFQQGCDVLASLRRNMESGDGALVDCVRRLYEAVRDVVPVS